MAMELFSNTDQFTKQLRDAFRKRSFGERVTRIKKHGYVYTSTQQDATIYLIESGKIKLLVSSPDGKECLLGIRTAGDIFGELCLSGQRHRLETAVAMQETTLRQIPYSSFLRYMRDGALMESLIQYLAGRIAEQQEVITTMATVNSEQRLGRTLLRLVRTLSRSAPCGIYIEPKLSQTELARMVGTTRSRIGMFLKKFRELGMIGLTPERCLIIDEKRLRGYLDRCLLCEETQPGFGRKHEADQPLYRNFEEAVRSGRVVEAAHILKHQNDGASSGGGMPQSVGAFGS